MSIKTEVEHHNFDEVEEIFVQESCDNVVKVGPTNLAVDDDIFCMEYESFPCG